MCLLQSTNCQFVNFVHLEKRLFYSNVQSDFLSLQVRGLCVMDLHQATVIVVTKQKKIELWDPLSRKVLHVLRIPDFDPCALCPSGWDTLLVANWSQYHPNIDKSQPNTEMLEIQATQMSLRRLDHKLAVELTSVISMVKSHKIIVMTSFNNDVIMAVHYLTGDLIWKLTKRDYEGVTIRPNGICSDEAGYIYVADTGMPYCRVFVISPLGKIVKKILHTAGWCYDITWINEYRKLIVLHDKTSLDKQDISIYEINQLPKPKLELDVI